MSGFFDGLAQAIFDPANVTGAFGGDRSDGRPIADFTDPTRNPRNANGIYNPPPPPPGSKRDIGFDPFGFGGLDQYMGSVKENMDKWDKKKRMDGFISSMTSSPGGVSGAFNPNVKIKPADWSAQWAYSPGKGPQWIEPKRVDQFDNYAPVVNTGPAKGNRF